MGIINVVDPVSGAPTPIRISGDTPSATEQERINQWIASRTPQQAAPVAAPEPEGGGIGGLFSGFGRGFAGSFAQLPGGLAGLGEAALGYTPGSTRIGGAAQDISEAGMGLVTDVFGEAGDTGWEKTGQAVGSLASFFVPGLGLAKGAAALGAGTRGAMAASAAGTAGMGAGLGTSEQLGRIEQYVASGGNVTEGQIRAAALTGGIIGLSEAIPVSAIVNRSFNLLRRVPKEAREEAIATITGRLKRAGRAGLEEGGQEVFASIAQDLAEKGIYNPDVPVGQSAADSFIYGGGAGAGIQYILDSIAGRRIAAGKQMEQDLKAEQEEAIRRGDTVTANRLQREIDRQAAEDKDAAEQRNARDVFANEEQAALLESELANMDIDAEERALRYEAADDEQAAALEQAVAGQDFVAGMQTPKGIAGLLPPPTSDFSGQPMGLGPIPRLGTMQQEEEARAGREAAALREARLQALPTKYPQIPDLRQEPSGAPIPLPEKMRTMQGFSRQQEKEAEAGRKASEARQMAATTALERAAQNAEKIVKDTQEAQAATKRVRKKPQPEAVADVAKVTAVEPDGYAPSSLKRTKVSGKKKTADYGSNSGLIEVIETPDGERYIVEKQNGSGTSFPTGYYAYNANDGVTEAVYVGDRREEAIESVMGSLSLDGDLTTNSEMKTGTAPKSKQVRQEAKKAKKMTPAQEAEAKADELWGTKRKSQIGRANEAASSSFKPPEELTMAMRKQLNAVGLKDVDLSITDVVDGDASVEGMEQDRGLKSSIALALDIYDPELGLEALSQKLGEVLNHEIIHALRTMDLFKSGEFSALTKAVSNQKVVGRDGKKRKYTYLEYQQAKNERFNMGLSDAAVVEEAIAEMYRDHSAGRLKLAGKPANIWQKIMKFIRAVGTAGRSLSIDRADQVFKDIQSGKVGGRDRGIARQGGRSDGLVDISNPETINDAQRYSRLVEQTDEFKEWNDGNALKDENGNPVLLYRGLTFDEKKGPEPAAMRLEPKRGFSVFASPNPYLANTYAMTEDYETNAGMRGIMIPFYVWAKKVKEFPSAPDGTFDMKGFDKFASELLPGEVAVVRKVRDVGYTVPSRQIDPTQKYKELSDVYAFGPKADTKKLFDFGAPTGNKRLSKLGVMDESERMKMGVVPQRRPIGKGTVDPDDPDYKVDIASMLPRQVETAAEIFKKYPGFTPTSDNPQDIVMEFKDFVRDNLVWLYQKTEKEKGAGFLDAIKRWYIGANKVATKLANRWGVHPNAASAVIAVTSPQTEWNTNVSKGERIGDIYTNSNQSWTWTPEMETLAQTIGDNKDSGPLYLRPERRHTNADKEAGIAKEDIPTHLDTIRGKSFYELLQQAREDGDYLPAARWLRLYDEAYNGRYHRELNTDGEFIGKPKAKTAWGSFSEIAKALEILENPTYETISRVVGDKHKVRNFYNNIAAPMDERGGVTIDTHAVGAGTMRVMSSASPEVHQNFGSTPPPKDKPADFIALGGSKVNGISGTYPVFADAYREAAAKVGVMPREMQSITWEAIRNIMLPNWKSQKTREEVDAIWSLVDKGEITPNEARERITDFAGGIRTPSWFRSSDQAAAKDEGTSYEGQLSGNDGAGGGGTDSGTGGGDAGVSAEVEPRSVRRSQIGTAPRSAATGNPQAAGAQELIVTHSATQKLVSKALNFVLPTDVAEEYSERFFTLTQDSFLPVAKLIDEMRERGITIPESMDAYVQEQIKHGKVGAEMDKNKEKLYEPTLQHLRGLELTEGQLNELRGLQDGSNYFADREKWEAQNQSAISRKLGGKPDIALMVGDAYLYARHAKDRNRYIREKFGDDNGSGMSDQEADAILAWVANLPTRQKNYLEQFAKGIDGIVADTNLRRKNSGLISENVGDFTTDPVTGQESFDQRALKNYVPLRGKRGEDGELSEDTVTGKRRLSGREDRQIKGRRGQYAGISPAMMAMTQNAQAINRSENNKVVQSFANMLRENPLPDVATLSGAPQTLNDPNYISFKENGETKHIRAYRSSIARAFDKTLNPDSGNVALRGMYRLNRALSQLITTYNPEFLFTNMPRDIETAMVNASQYEIEGMTKDIWKALPASTRAIWKHTVQGKRGDLAPDWNAGMANLSEQELLSRYQEYMSAGGKQMINQMGDLDSAHKEIQRLMKENRDTDNPAQAAGKIIRKAGDFMENVNEVGENASRFALYMALRSKGVSKDSAATAARNVTTNFSKKGELAYFMGAWSLFYNASLQGSMAMINAAARSKTAQKALATTVFVGILMDQINAALSEEDESGVKGYDRLQDYELEHNIMIPTGFITGSEGFVSIPLAYGLNHFFNMGRVISAVTRGAMTPGEGVNSFTGTLLEIVNPLGDDHSMVSLVSPTVLDPFINIAQNEDFTGRAIFKDAFPGDPGKSRAYQHWTSTSPTWQAVAKSLNDWTGGNEIQPGLIDFSPDTMEYLWNYYTGGLGRFIDRTASMPTTVLQPLAEGSFDGEQVEATPLLRRLYSAPSTRGDLGMFMDKFNRVRLAREEYKTAVENQDNRWAARVRDEKGDLLKRYVMANGINNARRKLVQMRNAITANTQIPDDVKAERLRQIAEREAELITRGLQILKEVPR